MCGVDPMWLTFVPFGIGLVVLGYCAGRIHAAEKLDRVANDLVERRPDTRAGVDALMGRM